MVDIILRASGLRGLRHPLWLGEHSRQWTTRRRGASSSSSGPTTDFQSVVEEDTASATKAQQTSRAVFPASPGGHCFAIEQSVNERRQQDATSSTYNKSHVAIQECNFRGIDYGSSHCKRGLSAVKLDFKLCQASTWMRRSKVNSRERPGFLRLPPHPIHYEMTQTQLRISPGINSN